MATPKTALEEFLTRGVDTVYPSVAALKKRLHSGKPLTLYLGVDPSAPDIHIGHLVALQKLRQAQALGQRVILLMGDFTGQTGDPTDKHAVRIPLTKEQVLANARHYQDQVSHILPFEGPNAVQVCYNSAWLEKLTFGEVAELAGHFTVQQMLERDMFENRLKEGKPISLREFMYPLMQGYDSVAMDVDLEVGGTDQTFNMLAGRKLVKEYLGKDKAVLTVSLLADSSGVKIGKTAGNAIAIAGPPEELYGQVMTLPDEVIGDALEWCTSVSMSDVRELRKLAATAPRDAKMKLASAIVAECQGTAAAAQGQEHFVTVFQEKSVPTDLPTWHPASAEMTLGSILKESGLATSSSEAFRLIRDQRAVRVNDVVVTDPYQTVARQGNPVIQVGKKRFLKIV